MPRGLIGEQRPADAVGTAVMVAKIATGRVEEPIETDDGKNKAAVELGRRGGQARAQKLSKERPSEIAREAANMGWRELGG